MPLILRQTGSCSDVGVGSGQETIDRETAGRAMNRSLPVRPIDSAPGKQRSNVGGEPA
jgi:hypothetical protein